jgi:C4-dicarboxylate transporter DctQ subunit
MRDVYLIYAIFLVVVPLRFGWLAYRAIRYGVSDPTSEAMDPTQK